MRAKDVLKRGRVRGWAAACGLLTALTAAPRGAAPAYAQTAEELEVVVAALPALRAHVPAGRAALDPDLLCTARLLGWECPEDFRAAVSAAGFSLNGREFTLVCLRGPDSCRLVRVDSLTSILSISLENGGRSARVAADQWYRSGGSVGMRSVDVRLRRAGNRWRVVDDGG